MQIKVKMATGGVNFTWTGVTHSFRHFDTFSEDAEMWNFMSDDSSCART